MAFTHFFCDGTVLWRSQLICEKKPRCVQLQHKKFHQESDQNGLNSVITTQEVQAYSFFTDFILLLQKRFVFSHDGEEMTFSVLAYLTLLEGGQMSCPRAVLPLQHWAELGDT